jgi:Domain of unknown function (DUF222)
METTAAQTQEPESGSVRQALESAKSAIKFLADADMTQLPSECIAELLTAMEQMDAGQAAVRGQAVSILSDQQIYQEYGHRAPSPFLIHFTRVKGGKAKQVAKLGSLYRHHRVLAAALAEQDVVSESIAVQIAAWTDKLPDDCVEAADGILIEACRAGLSEILLADLAAQILAQVCGPDPEDEGKLEERTLRVETTLDGAGRIDGNLTPACTALLKTVLDAFGQKAGPEDHRSPHERNHDALEEALKLVLAGKRGKPFKAVVHIAFADLLALQGASAMMEAYSSQVADAMAARAAERARDAQASWSGHRAADQVTGGGDGGTWLTGDRALAILPDAMIAPVITTRIAAEHMENIGIIGAELHHLAGQLAEEEDTEAAAGPDGDDSAQRATDAAASRAQRDARMMDLRLKLIGEAIALVAGPDAVGAWLRRRLLGAPGTGPLAAALAGKSLPLDVGLSKTIPPQIRLAAVIRSPYCQAPGCTQPAWESEPHHLKHREYGGPTNLDNIDTYCWWHHHVLIHKMGWSAGLNGDGTPILRKPDGTTLPNGPPTRPG